VHASDSDGLDLPPAKLAPSKILRWILECCVLSRRLFIFATYPQFMKSDDGPLWPQGLLMGSMTAFVQLIVYGGWH
jgi:hypothetical protein